MGVKKEMQAANQGILLENSTYTKTTTKLDTLPDKMLQEISLTNSTYTTIRTKLDTLPDEILIHIAEYTGADSCYLSFGSVNKRLNQLFDTYTKQLSKKTSYGGYAPSDKILDQCDVEFGQRRWELELYLHDYLAYHDCDDDDDYKIPEICHQLACGVVSFNREDLLQWALETQSAMFLRAICERAIKAGKLDIVKKVWESIEVEDLLYYMNKCQTIFTAVVAEEGDLDTLKYLHKEIGCKWDSRSCDVAAAGGHLDCLKYMRDNGLIWDRYDEYLGSIG